jgi:hypothetical protein
MSNKKDNHNKIPFENLDLRVARRIEHSPYAQFFNAMAGFYVFDRESRTKVFKHELWALCKNKPRDRKKIMEKSHKKYVFITKEQWQNM